MTAERRRPPRLGQLLGRLFALTGIVVVAATVAGAVSYARLDRDRSAVIDRIDPAVNYSNQLLAAYLDQETAVRGFVLTREQLFLQPYRSGTAAAASATTQLRRLVAPGTADAGLLDRVAAAARAWTSGFATPAVAAGAGGGPVDGTAQLTRGKDLFDSLRASVAALQVRLRAERAAAERRLARSGDLLVTVLIVSLVVLVLAGTAIGVALRRLVLKPLAAVGEDTRRVSGGELTHEVRPSGPEEIADLARGIEAMRTRIFAEVQAAREAEAQLTATNEDLRRSNEDLEQFAYVASHDLQEPLRKVTSFCQLLEQRYSGQLDERGEQYIAFAVDGAKRMQVLINDLLAFSRIGRSTERFVPVDLAECVALAERNLAGAIEAAGASVEVAGSLPTVAGDRTLLVALMQNLIGNAVKFHGDAPPLVRITAEEVTAGEPAAGGAAAGEPAAGEPAAGGAAAGEPAAGEPAAGEEATGGPATEWLISVTDNGIGIEPRFAERIFVIFQRLHGRDAYSGTGIGLAMCRKIAEFHGGRIRLDTDHRPGTRFCLTLPALPTEEDPDELHEPAVRTG